MRLNIKKTVECNKYEVLIKFEEFGSEKLTAEEEKELINDYCLKLKLSDITFEGKYKYDNKKVVADSVGGEDVTLTVINKTYPLNEELEIKYGISASDIKKDEIKTSLNTADLVCKAKVELFVDKIIEQITTLIESKITTFDTDYETETSVVIGN